jgi:flagella basal body P-ring formation protein FlgA
MTVLHAVRRLSFLLALSAPLAPAAPAGPVERLVEQAAREQLDQRMASAGMAEAEYELSVVSARAAPPCARPVTVDPIDTRQSSRMRFAVRCPDGAGRSHEYVVRARITAPVAVTAAPVAAGETLLESSVTLERRDITNVADALGTPDAALGQTTRRSLRAGELLRASQLAAPLLVKRGDAVVMVARMEGIEVTTAGQALDAGARGAMIRVRNAASGQIVRMRVIGAGTVEPVEMARISPPLP